MIARVQGVYQNGDDYVPTIPRNAARTLSVPMSGLLRVVLRVVTPKGVLVDLAGMALTLTVRRAYVTPGTIREAQAASSCGCEMNAGPCGGTGCSGGWTGRLDPVPGARITADLAIVGAIDASAGLGVAGFAITPSQTKAMEPGRYAYDVWMRSGLITGDEVVPVSPFLVLPAVGFA